MQVSDIGKLEKSIQDGLSSLYRIDAEKELIAGIIDAAAEDNNIDKKVVRKLIATAYKKSSDIDKYNDEKGLFEDVFGFVDAMSV